MKNKNLLIGVVVVVIALGGLYIYSHKSDGVVGSIGTNPIENYVPAIKYNEGYYSELPISTLGSITSTATSTTATSTTGALQIGASGSTISLYKFNTCTPSFSSADMTASTTVVGICTDSSIRGDETIVATQLYRGAATGFPTAGLFPVYNITATTSGQYGIRITNATGAATTSINSIYRLYSVTIVR